MSISSLNNLRQSADYLQKSDLNLVVHGPIKANIGLVCHGNITTDVVEAANFINLTYVGVRVNVIQLTQLNPLPAEELRKMLRIYDYIAVVESDVELELIEEIRIQLGIRLRHRWYVNPNQPKVVTKIISNVQRDFFIHARND